MGTRTNFSLILRGSAPLKCACSRLWLSGLTEEAVVRITVGAADRVIWFTRFGLAFLLAGIGFASYSFGVTGWEELGRFRKLR